MDEAQLIVQAMQMSTPFKRKHKVLREIEPSLIDVSDDAISRMAGKKTKKQRNKPLKQWEPTEFLKHFVKSLSNYDMALERLGARDREDMAFLYDELVRRVGEQMNNTVMRDYLDWWTGTHARKLYDQEIYVRTLANDRYLNQFVSLKLVSKLPTPDQPNTDIPKVNKEVDAQTLYSIGGLPTLLRSKGIVVAARILREKEDNNWLMRISQALQDFPKEAVQETMLCTTGSTYPSEDMVDFISIARPALEYHRIKDYLSMNYRDCFEG